MPSTSADATFAALRRGDLAGARHLSLPCGLTELPREVLALGDTLEVLDLSGNALTALPADFGRLRALRVLFAAGNRFAQLPPVLADCPALSQVMFRGNGLREVPAESLPRALRWLALTDNRLDVLPAALGERPALQKVMLAGNRLTALPETLAGAPALELLRLAANRFETLPSWLTTLPRLAWLSWAGNPMEPTGDAPAIADVPWSELDAGVQLGEGASGQIHRARWRPMGSEIPRDVALKLFKGAMTSDGLPEREMAACLAAGVHPHLVAALGRVSGHPTGTLGLVMPLLPPHWRALAGPPSLDTCSRDVYDASLRLSRVTAVGLARAVASAVAHLHAKGLSHGDVYAHNVMWNGERHRWQGSAALADFGAASRLPQGPHGARMQRLEVRAVGVLLGELLDRLDAVESVVDPLRELQQQCLQPDVDARPAIADVADALGG